MVQMSNISELAKTLSARKNTDACKKAYIIDNTHCQCDGKIYRITSVVPCNIYKNKIVYVSILNNYRAIIIGD